ncbi:alpha/beta hydrolase [Jannaschia seohaensis]|uniref:Alpha/beta hydrolase family protein DUF900 n=1 Tax=Jannaschia seohaensis TaxID=475081 RepID=A0A2Y9AA33_9RHOB|nr:alpha/beta hydrolase [Jannaschia seohaensis]PWJ20763.1 alpha/beta hydrolase family protein DUF900 [Jannaschia seohaensis]SSA41105.1 Alpha/beta hydrolase of unknown function [Jannaschia seohaensis]
MPIHTPDIDLGIFKRILPRFRPVAQNITVDAMSGDRPLALSAQLHGYPRLGEAGNGVSDLEGVEVIDLSDLPNEGPAGHLNHVYNEAVGDDLRRLLHSSERADARLGLVVQGGILWSLRPAPRD